MSKPWSCTIALQLKFVCVSVECPEARPPPLPAPPPCPPALPPNSYPFLSPPHPFPRSPPNATHQPSDALFAWFRIYLELLHDYQLAKEYCDGLYEESRHADRKGMQQLPASLQARLQGVGGPGGETPGGAGGNTYLLLIQVTIIEV